MIEPTVYIDKFNSIFDILFRITAVLLYLTCEPFLLLFD